MRVAMISYNAFISGEGNGWKQRGENHVLLLQNENGESWGVNQLGGGAAECRDQVTSLWEQLSKELPTLDKVIFYVGSSGAERAIELASDHGLTPDRAVFVFCDCNMQSKQGVIHDRGFADASIMMCECGGHSTMSRIYDHVLEHGTLPS